MDFCLWRVMYDPDGNFIDSDWAKAHAVWLDMTGVDQIYCENVTSKYIEETEPRYVKSPQNYLKDEEFLRKPRPKSRERDRGAEMMEGI